MSLLSHTQGQGEPLVLLHGWAMNRAIWSDFLTQLSQYYQVTWIELPGHGESLYASDLPELNDWAQACLAVAPKKAIWLGWSLGGLIAQHIAISYPDRISRLICMASTPCFQQRLDWSSAMPMATLQQFADSLIQDYKQTLSHFLALQVMGQPQSKGLLRDIKQRLLAAKDADLSALQRGLSLLSESDLRLQLHEIQCKQLWVFGAKDRLVPVAACIGIQAINPNADVLVIDKASHLPFLTHRALCIQAITS